MTNKPRNRVVVFRLSQEEYRSLKDACDRAGARNLSDFTRSEVLEHLRDGDCSEGLNRLYESLQQRVTNLQVQLNNILQGVMDAEPRPQP